MLKPCSKPWTGFLEWWHQRGLRSRIVPNCTLSQNGYGDISGRKRCQVMVRSMQFDSGQCGAVGQENEKGQKLAAPWSSQAVPHHSTNQALGCLISEVGRDLVLSTGMAASDMEGRKMLLAARMARDREGSIQYPIVKARQLSWRSFLWPASKAGRAGGCFLHKVSAVGFEPRPSAKLS